MKIYRNNVQIDMELDEFLEILESDLMDDLLEAVVELDEMGLGGEPIYAKIVEMDEEEWEELGLDEEDGGIVIQGLDDIYGVEPFPYYSKADEKVRRILDLFGDDFI